LKSIVANSQEPSNEQSFPTAATLVSQEKRELLDTNTGEVIWVDQITKTSYGAKNFWKCYLMDFLSILGIIDSKQLDVFIYIVENTNPSNNTFLGTYKKISADTGCSSKTIAAIIKKLQANNFIKRIQNGAWLVNPNILMRGNDKKRQILLSYYESDEPIDEITFNRSKRLPFDETNGSPAISAARSAPALIEGSNIETQNNFSSADFDFDDGDDSDF